MGHEDRRRAAVCVVESWRDSGRVDLPVFHGERREGAKRWMTAWTIDMDPVAGLAWALHALPPGAAIDQIRFESLEGDWRCDVLWR
jgi:hypothetical protein